MPNEAKTYYEEVTRQMIKEQRRLLEQLPRFCTEFFRGIDATTAPRTRVGYARDIKLFFYFIVTNIPDYKGKSISDIPLSLLDALQAVDIEEYMEFLKLYTDENGNEISNSEYGVKRKMSSLRVMYQYFYNHERIKNNPASIVSMPKLHKREIVRFDENEMYDFLEKVEMGTNLTKRQLASHEKTKKRDLAMMTLLLGTGIRVSECVGLNKDDIDFNSASIRIIRKGGNVDIVYFGYEVEDRLLDYMEERETIIPLEEHKDALFLSSQRKRISVRTVEKMVEKYAKITDTLKHITPHKLRSTYGTQLYRETGDIYLVADVLGHKDVNTTKKHYATVDEDKKRNARNKVQLRDSSEFHKDGNS